jgi:predicted CxxxxCH...CXXCH cytochrome family protein
VSGDRKKRWRMFAISVPVAVFAVYCSKERPLQGPLGEPVSWTEEVAPLFAANCNSCHSGAAAQAGYRTTSYLEALGPVAAPVAIAGNANSLLLTVIDPARADAVHAPVAFAFDAARAWVVDGRLALFRSGVHESGILNPNDAQQFHATLLRAANWNFSQCQECHGSELTGGASGVSCQQCHSFQVAAGTPACSVCHGSALSPAPPRDLAGNTGISAPGVGAHQAHLVGRTDIAAPIACGVCHQVPATAGSPGHLDHFLPATVVFSGLAVADGALPVWDHETASCSNSYCHGGGKTLAVDTSFKLRTPVWTGGASQASCGTCHGLPPSGIAAHAGVTFPDCARCHSSTVDANGLIIVAGSPGAQTSTHMNGVVDVTP